MAKAVEGGLDGLEGRFVGLGALRDDGHAGEGAKAHVAAAGEEGDEARRGVGDPCHIEDGFFFFFLQKKKRTNSIGNSIGH